MLGSKRRPASTAFDHYECFNCQTVISLTGDFPVTTLRSKSDSGTGTAESVESFVHRQNIHRYRRLLETERDDRKRQTLLTMLAQEESETKECKVAESL